MDQLEKEKADLSLICLCIAEILNFDHCAGETSARVRGGLGGCEAPGEAQEKVTFAVLNVKDF